MRALVHAGSVLGIDAHPVVVEVDFTRGLPGFDVVGLAEVAVRESRVRVSAAVEACGYEMPDRRLLLNLAPGDLRKRGSGFDLAIAIGVLAATGQCAPSLLDDTLFIGELSLAGELRTTRGVLAQLRSARAHGLTRAVVPDANADEAALAVGLDVRVARHLREVVGFLDGTGTLEPPRPWSPPRDSRPPPPDLADVRGQWTARRALEIAAAGGHHLLFVGPPGTGKTMLARRLPGILPPPTPTESLDIATIAGAAGLPVRVEDGFVPRPFRAPHHTASVAALVGGGDPVRPGEVTLAHRGVLFLDEIPELRRDAIEALRVTMESGKVHVARVGQRVTMPARSLVVAAMNPCPCGFAGDARRVCRCSVDRIERYAGRVSGPILDRFDLHVVVPRLATRELHDAGAGEPSSVVRDRVVAARDRAAHRASYAEGLALLGAGVSAEARHLLDEAFEALGLSARGYVKVLRVARTIADLAAAERVEAEHVAEAVQYRLLDRRPASARAASA